MVRIQTGSDLGMAILKALGIDDKRVISLDISCKANDMATVSIVRCLDKVEAGKLIEVLEQYALVRKEDLVQLPVVSMGGDPAAPMETVARNLLKG